VKNQGLASAIQQATAQVKPFQWKDFFCFVANPSIAAVTLNTAIGML